jgi:hypothetical protein
MDKFTKGKQDNIKMMSNVRLESCLIRCGISLEKVEHMDRNSMINKWAELAAAKANKPTTAAVSTVGYDTAFENEKLPLENFKFEQELKFQGELETAKLQQEKLA